MSKINSAWFIDKIKARHKSIRRFSSLLFKNGKNIDRAQVWRMIHGQRAMTVSEAKQISKLLDEPLLEVIKQASM